jgi:hypothetical protein
MGIWISGALDSGAVETTAAETGAGVRGAVKTGASKSGALDIGVTWSSTGTETEESRVRKEQNPDMPVVPASSSMLIGSSLRFGRERELPLIQLSFEMNQ